MTLIGHKWILLPSNHSDDWMEEVSTYVQSMSLLSSPSKRSPSFSCASSSKAHHSPNHFSPPNHQYEIEDMEILLTPKEGSQEEYEKRYAAALVEAKAAKAKQSMRMHSIPSFPAKGAGPTSTPSHGGAADTLNNGAIDGSRLSYTRWEVEEVRDYVFYVMMIYVFKLYR
jgi:hypothetical protein